MDLEVHRSVVIAKNSAWDICCWILVVSLSNIRGIYWVVLSSILSSKNILSSKSFLDWWCVSRLKRSNHVAKSYIINCIIQLHIFSDEIKYRICKLIPQWRRRDNWWLHLKTIPYQSLTSGSTIFPSRDGNPKYFQTALLQPSSEHNSIFEDVEEAWDDLSSTWPSIKP